MTSFTISIAVTFLFTIQSQNNIHLNGKVDEVEWKGAKEYQINSDCKVFILQEKEVLYAALVSKKKIWAHTYLSDGETVQVMHASAALDDVTYRKVQSVWRTEETFQWGFREQVYTSDVQAKMDSYFQANGWVANNGNMADGKIIEFKIDISQTGPLFFTCVMADYDLNLSHFPSIINDDTILPRLVQGNTPDSLKFEPVKWLKIKGN